MDKLVEVVKQLRDKDFGCAWDLQQNLESLIKYTSEEFCELIHAIANKDFDNIKEELGDLLFHIVFYAQIAKEQGAFDIDEVADEVANKLIRRHPHVFDNPNHIKYSDDELKAQWLQIKALESQIKSQTSKKSNENKNDSFEAIKNLPALQQSIEIQNIVAKDGFDWPNVYPVLDKIREEIDEVEHEIKADNADKIEEEIGDLMFALTNLCRHTGVEPELALQKANNKFTQRYAKMLDELKSQGIEVDSATLEQMEKAWQAIK